MEFLDEIFSELLVLFFHGFKVTPFLRVKEVHEVEKLADVVV